MDESPPTIPLEFERLPPDEQVRRARASFESAARRRSVRDFAPDPVPREAIELAVAAAGRAPSGANQQPWTFCAVGDPALKRRIREAAEREERESYERRMTAEWKDALAPLGTDWRKPHLEVAPWLIVVFEQAHGLADDGDGGARRVTHYYPHESVGIATGFLLAALHAAGLATLVHTPSPMNFLRTILGRPANEKPFAVIVTGLPADGCRVPAIAKKPLDDILIVFEGGQPA